MSLYFPQCVLKLRILPEDFQFTSDASKQKVYEVVVIPKSISVNIGDIKTSDTFNCELDYKTFPFDPRVIRSCAVTVHMQDMLFGNNPIIPKDSNAVFAGFVDEQSVTLDDTARTVRFEGRDFTALLIDQKYPGNRIDTELPLDIALQRFLNEIPATQKIVVLNKTGDVLPIIATYHADFRNKLAAGRNTGAHESYWDIIQDMVSKAGLVCFISLNSLVIHKPRNLFDSSIDMKMIYGQNVKNLTFKRKLGRLKNFNLLVRAFSESEKKVIEALIPEESNADWSKSFGVPQQRVKVPVMNSDGSLNPATQDAPIIAFPVRDVTDKSHLIILGQAAYEEYSMQQLEGTIETNEMIAPRNIPLEPIDLTQLDIGTPIGLEIAVEDIAEFTRYKTLQEREDFLIRRGYSKEVAFVLASTYGKMSQRFFTKAFSLTLSEQGFKVKINFVNIIDTRNNKLLRQ